MNFWVFIGFLHPLLTLDLSLGEQYKLINRGGGGGGECWKCVVFLKVVFFYFFYFIVVPWNSVCVYVCLGSLGLRVSELDYYLCYECDRWRIEVYLSTHPPFQLYHMLILLMQSTTATPPAIYLTKTQPLAEEEDGWGGVFIPQAS